MTNIEPPNQPQLDEDILKGDFDPLPDLSNRTSISERKENIRGIVATVAILIAAPLIALFITSFVFQSYEVFGPSMQNTLQSADRLIVLKFPKSWANLTKSTYIPNRGEIIIFNRQEIQFGGENDSRQLIKRVVGLPGERVVVNEGTVKVFNSENPNGFQPDKTGGYQDTALVDDTTGNVDLTVSEGEVFVMGDHRANSLDSRSFGTVNNKDIVGRAIYRFLPISAMNRF